MADGAPVIIIDGVPMHDGADDNEPGDCPNCGGLCESWVVYGEPCEWDCDEDCDEATP